MLIVVANHQSRSLVRIGHCRHVPAPGAMQLRDMLEHPAGALAKERCRLPARERMDVARQGALDAQRIVLLRLFAKGQEMIGGEVDAADVSNACVDGNDLAMQSSK